MASTLRHRAAAALGWAVLGVVMALVGAAPAAALPLAPPPAAATPGDAADRAAIADDFTPDRIAQASRDRVLDPFGAFVSILGDAFVSDGLPATRRVLAAVQVAVGRVVIEAKGLFPRTRPYAEDAAFQRCPGTLFLAAERSYPSGHAAVGQAWGIVLAALLPERGPVLLARGADYGASRVVCGFHWPSDVAAGQAIGAAVAADLLADPGLARLLRRARDELAPFG